MRGLKTMTTMLSIDDINDALAPKGLVLAEEQYEPYSGTISMMQFQCLERESHHFTARLSNVIYSDRGCPHCTRKRKKEEMARKGSSEKNPTVTVRMLNNNLSLRIDHLEKTIMEMKGEQKELSGDVQRLTSFTIEIRNALKSLLDV